MATRKKSTSKGKDRVVLTKEALVVTLTAADRKAMEACLRKSGRITLQFKQIEVTKLPGIGNLSVDPTTD